MVNKRCLPLALGLVLALSGCGTGEMSLTEYVERINAIENQASQRGAELVADAAQVSDLTPQDVQAGLEQARAIRLDIKEATDDIEPPEQIAELHHLIFDWHTEFITVEEALANRAGAAADTATDWEALSNSPEMAAYRTAIADGKQVCNDFQAKLDATAERGVFADMPWVPSEMTEVVEAVLGCAWFPENPEDVYRYPPATSSP
jgi:hypothetical protein